MMENATMNTAIKENVQTVLDIGQKKLSMKEIDFYTAKEFIEKWHYSKCVPHGKNLFFGWYNGEELYAVANYGWGVNPYQEKFLASVTGKPVCRENCLELKRLCRSEPKLNAELTQFLSACHRELHRRKIRFIVSFSDPAFNHNGGIYKAASFRYLGKTNAEWHLVDSSGKAVHRRIPYRHSRRNGITISESREQLKLARIKTVPKDRWFKII